MPGGYQDAGVEPALEDLLADPIVRLVLERDGIDPADLRRFLASVRERLQSVEHRAASERSAAA